MRSCPLPAGNNPPRVNDWLTFTRYAVPPTQTKGHTMPTMTYPAFLSRQDTWTNLAPTLHIADPTFWAQHEPECFPPTDFQTPLRREGYLRLDPPDGSDLIVGLATAIRSLHAHGIPPVFAFHYDEAWLLMARLRPLIAAILGPDYAMLPEFWAWHVDPATEDSGWPPHRDKGRRALLPDGTPLTLTVWLPLTDATPENGCMYVVPADRDPTYNTPEEAELRFALTDIRALPAVAGSVLAWNQAIIHWGAHAARRDATPRISLSCEFQRRDTAPFAESLLNPTRLPDFSTRQNLIARQLPRYQHMEPLTPVLAAWVAAMAVSAG